MLGTNAQFRMLVSSLDRQIEALERLDPIGQNSRATSMVEVLCSRRRALRLLLLNRQVEAARPIVNFQKWRDGNGAIHLIQSGAVHGGWSSQDKR